MGKETGKCEEWGKNLGFETLSLEVWDSREYFAKCQSVGFHMPTVTNLGLR